MSVWRGIWQFKDRQPLLIIFKNGPAERTGEQKWHKCWYGFCLTSFLSNAEQIPPLRVAVHRYKMDLIQSTRGSEVCSLLATANTATLCSKINGAAQKKATQKEEKKCSFRITPHCKKYCVHHYRVINRVRQPLNLNHFYSFLREILYRYNTSQKLSSNKTWKSSWAGSSHWCTTADDAADSPPHVLWQRSQRLTF